MEIAVEYMLNDFVVNELNLWWFHVGRRPEIDRLMIFLGPR